MTQIYNEQLIEAMKKGVHGLLYEWGMPETSRISLLNISENATFVAEAPEENKKMILRIHRPDYHTRQEIASELIWIDSLRDQGIVSTAAPIPLVSGGKIAGFNCLGADRFAVGFEFLQGSEPSPENDLKDDFYTLGAVTARLHGHTKGWATPIGFKRKVWDFDSMLGDRPLWGDWRNAMGLDGKGHTLLAQTSALLHQHLDRYGKEPNRFGLVHADLRLANLLTGEGALHVIDFDDCGYSWFMYDFAAAISFMEEDTQIPELQNAWVKGYRSVSFLDTEDEAVIPTFIMLRRMLLTAWLASHSETQTAREMGSAYTEGTLRLAEKYLNTGTTY